MKISFYLIIVIFFSSMSVSVSSKSNVETNFNWLMEHSDYVKATLEKCYWKNSQDSCSEVINPLISLLGQIWLNHDGIVRYEVSIFIAKAFISRPEEMMNWFIDKPKEFDEWLELLPATVFTARSEEDVDNLKELKIELIDSLSKSKYQGYQNQYRLDFLNRLQSIDIRVVD